MDFISKFEKRLWLPCFQRMKPVQNPECQITFEGYEKD